ncbi:MAG: alanyl-tRNA editing protein [Clostridia bacterium]|nr:alanyl-tRNA editing protein [Clostridia bacterium]
MQKTVKLYDTDSHLKEFEATVLLCEKSENGYKTVLDKTAFFPEGGGQPCDIGTLNGGNVTDVQISDGIITHTVDIPLEIGNRVKGKLDFLRRFNFMQNHSGEHIVSGIVNSLYGLDNVGFHLNESFVTLDFNGELNYEQLKNVELIANSKVWQNVKFKTYYPDKTTLKSLNYRSKKELDGDIRIVEIENTDICACCAPHVSEAGEIGIIKLLDTEKMRGGIRIVMKCGKYALDDYNCKYGNILSISNLLSSKQEETAQAVVELQNKLNDAKVQISALKKRLTEYIIKSFKGEDGYIFEDGLDGKERQLLADGLHKTYGGIKAVFTKAQDGYAFSICGEPTELDGFFENLCKNLNVRGGGRNGIKQGTVLEDKDKITEVWSKLWIGQK